MNPYLKGFFHSYSEIFFLQSPLAGVLFFLVTLTNPNVGIAGVISVLAAYLFAHLIGMREAFLGSGFLPITRYWLGFPLVAHRVRRTPEEYVSDVRRFGGCLCKLALPFSGKWTVWQGFDGAWTH